jgi:hypothetical protein
MPAFSRGLAVGLTENPGQNYKIMRLYSGNLKAVRLLLKNENNITARD